MLLVMDIDGENFVVDDNDGVEVEHEGKVLLDLEDLFEV